MSEFHDAVEQRLIRYAKINTQSGNDSDTVPTTMCQFDLARLLEEELKGIGAVNVWLDEKVCVLYAEIPGNVENCRTLGLIAHMDTAPDAPGDGVKPWVLRNYDGSDITLNAEKNIVIKVSEFPNLQKYMGDDLVLTDGTTLLGGDDKASIAAIMTFAEYLLKHPEIPHGRICLAFTPDEEVGGLACNLDLQRFGSDTAYTLDGDYCGAYIDETFNASMARVEVKGRSVHTGTAKGKMINAVDVLMEYASCLPADERPQNTEGREGFFHVYEVKGGCEHASMDLIVRDFDAGRFQKREEYLGTIRDELNVKYGDIVSLRITEQYRSMKEVIDQHPWLVENLKEAIRACGIEPATMPFRGGTDGSALSWRGLPCPNLSAGYENAHSRFEYVPVRSMEMNVMILLKLAEIFSTQSDMSLSR
ncbi:MAG: peptidase T [Bulleidia sp.]|nr:peptidase T [Bulleidia sp.]